MPRNISRFPAALFFGLAVLAAVPLCAQTAPSTTPSSAASTAPQKPSFDQLLAGKTAAFSYTDAPVNTVIDALGKTYGIEVENNYRNNERGVSVPVIVDITASRQGEALPVPLITARISGEISAREALAIVNATIMPYGFAAVETVRLRADTKAPYPVVTILPTRKDAGASRPVFYGMDPKSIPEGDEIRTQVIALKNLELTKAKDIVASVLGKGADITVNEDRKTLILTDTATHIHSAAVVLQILENQAAAPK